MNDIDREKEARRQKWLREHGYVGPMKGMSNSERRIWRALAKKSRQMKSEDERGYYLAQIAARRITDDEEKRRVELARKALRAEKAVARIIPMIKLRMQGNTLVSIGEKYGLSRERVRQLTKKYATAEEHAVWKSRPRTRKGKERVEIKCKTCGKPMLMFPGEARRRRFCSLECRIKLQRKWETPKGLRNNERLNWLYHNNPHFRQQHIRRCINRYNRVKGMDEYEEAQKVYQRRAREKEAFGEAVTPLPATTRRRRTASIPDQSVPEAHAAKKKHRK